jgi:hypothetical protein
MHRLARLPAHFPANSKYVLESRGPWVRRYLEFPDGRTLELTPRKAATCHCAELVSVAETPPAADTKRRKRSVGAAA